MREEEKVGLWGGKGTWGEVREGGEIRNCDAQIERQQEIKGKT